MQLEVFDYNAYVYVHTASRLSFEAEPLSTAHQHVLKLQFRLDTQQPRSQALHQTLGLGPPAFHTYCVLARSEGDSGNAIASDGVPAVVVDLPDFKDELGPTAQGLGFVVDVEGVVPDDGFLRFFFDFFKGLSCVFAWEKRPIMPYSDIELDNEQATSLTLQNSLLVSKP